MAESEKKLNKKQFNDLLKRISLGEKDSMEEFYNYYGKLIKSAALSYTNSAYLAEEVINEVLIRVWQASQRDYEISSPAGWVYRITYNCAQDRLKREEQYFELYDEPRPDINMEMIDSDDAFHRAIAPLKENERQIIILKHIGSLTFIEIAKIMKLPATNVSAVYYRAVKKINKENF